MPRDAGVGGEQAVQAGLEPAPRPLAHQAGGVEIETVGVLEVRLHQRPLLQQSGAGYPLALPLRLRRWREPAFVPLVEPRDRVVLAPADAEG